MVALLEANWEWLLLATSAFSVLALIATLIALPWVLARLPTDYFNQPLRRSLRHSKRHPWLNVLIIIGKNLLGALLAILGLIMLVTPGQGLLTLLAGFFLMDFPGKYHLERKLVTSPGVLPAVNWMRKRRGSPPMDEPIDFG
ncbi:hypothetical protein H2508_08245 [Parahaliea sp. F7430]|uniref:Uncharacterized protein n=1 Tax=Sediminihaliea albiluteola TaxID=2758564 RepID=A0A7W2TW99_9GAMM|nr:hypothetical protein [Sediminihaliea albiluteola]MBA6413098.1 hypothetical protein [Sediminihaliea albiluteola]